MAQNPNDINRNRSSGGRGQSGRPSQSGRRNRENDSITYGSWDIELPGPSGRQEIEYDFDQPTPNRRRSQSGQSRQSERGYADRSREEPARRGGSHSASRNRKVVVSRIEETPPPRKKKKKKNGVLKGLYATIVVLAALIVVGYGLWKVLLPAPPNTDPALSSQETLEGGAVPGLSGGRYPHREQTYTFLLVCPDQESGNADAIMVVTYDVPNQKIGMLSIPRDTLVNEKNPKINSSYHAGIENLTRVVSDLTGLDFNFTVEIKLDVIEELVNQVDGIDFDVPVEMYYDDPAQDLHIHYMPGPQHLDGKQAVEVCRFRHNADGTGYALGDIERSQTVRNVMVTTAKKLISFSNVGKIKQFIDIFQRNVETNLTASDIIWFATQAMQLDLATSVTSGSLEGDGTVTYKGTKWCYQLYPDKALEAINTLVNPYSQTLTAQDLNIFQPG